ncbi:flavodoxin family protein [Fervidobacterium riparium]|nr:flavodoxin [Fervidobacterium riparium]
MKILITYSSSTGNTKKVAEGVFSSLSEKFTDVELKRVNEVDNIDEYDIIILGCWIDRGLPNAESKRFIETMRNKNVGFFITLSARLESQHAKDALEKTEELLQANGNKVFARYMCLGRLNPKLIEYFKTLPKDHPHALTEQKLNWYKELEEHPNAEDIAKAQLVFLQGVEELWNSKVE